MKLVCRLCLLLSLLGISSTSAQTPEWIWHKNTGDLPTGTEEIYLRKSFDVAGKIASAELKVAGDDAADVFLNEESLGTVKSRVAGRRGYAAETLDVTTKIRPGKNTIAAAAKNTGGPRGFIVRLTLTFADGKKRVLTSDTSWITRAEEQAGWETIAFDDSSWGAALRIGQDGDAPWYEMMDPDRAATGADLKLLPGFVAECIRTAGPDDGSWIALAIDDAGRLIVSAQDFISPEFGGMQRFTLDDGRITKEEKIMLPVGAAQGLVYGNDSLYVQGLGLGDQSRTGILPVPRKAAPQAPNQSESPPDTTNHTLGLYRVRDTDGDDQFDSVEFLKEVHNRGRGSHGPHGLTFGPDGMLYHISGDMSKTVDGIDPASPHRNYKEDLLLPRRWDASGHGRGIVAPCGHVQRTDPDGKHWELFAGGFRNPYDLAFNADGELFTFDADMEYDTGSPWYRPTRVYHVVSGGEYGQRAGTGKWPYYYHDSLPPVVDIGLGSPCGVVFGTGSHFPHQYQKALYMADWAYGKIYAVHLTEDGASYTGTSETFAEGRPLNAMDIEFGNDGAMYFITGGNNTSSALYRISYEGQVASQPGLLLEKRVAKGAGREIRRQLEAWHTKTSPKALALAWPHLDSPDRAIRYAARIAIERQDPTLWHERALKEMRPNASLTALLALARTADGPSAGNVLPKLLESLDRLKWNDLTESQKLELLRVYQVAFARLGAPVPKTRTALAKKLTQHYPAEGGTGSNVTLAAEGGTGSNPAAAGLADSHNRELCQLLIYLHAPDVIEKTLALLESATTQEQQIHYIFHLRNVRHGWTLPQRKQYFAWFDKAAREYSGGVSFYKFLANFKTDAIATVAPAQQPELEEYLVDFAIAPIEMPATPMKFVKAWTMEELEPHLDEASHGRSFSNGARAFRTAQCIICHRMFNEGGAIGPDLTAVASRFSRRDLLDSILNPSKAVLEQYRATTVIKKNGTELTGTLVEETDESLTIVSDPITQQHTKISLAEVREHRPSDISPMPAGFLNFLTKEEILDLLAWIEASGNRSAAAFRK